MVEQRPFKALVAGSSPAQPTPSYKPQNRIKTSSAGFLCLKLNANLNARKRTKTHSKWQVYGKCFSVFYDKKAPLATDEKNPSLKNLVIIALPSTQVLLSRRYGNGVAGMSNDS